MMGLPLWKRHQCIQRYECGHELCRDGVSFGDGGVCRRWVIVQWTFLSLVTWKQVRRQLVKCLGRESIRLWGRREATEEQVTYRLLVHVDPEGPCLTEEDLQVLKLEEERRWIFRFDLDWSQTLVVPFRCCSEFLYKTWPGWLLSILKQGGKCDGEERLRDELVLLIRQHARKWDEDEEPSRK